VIDSVEESVGHGKDAYQSGEEAVEWVEERILGAVMVGLSCWSLFPESSWNCAIDSNRT
jgi:endonuclease YncB( thermonuclease family)